MMHGAYADITQAIGNTPIVKLNKLTERSFKVISWHMYIEDAQLATMFALKFVK